MGDMTQPVEPTLEPGGVRATDDLVDQLAARLAQRTSMRPGPEDDCGLDADCPPDQICLDGHCT